MSPGSFVDQKATIGQWYADLYDILCLEASSSQVLVGSSMGVWLALLVALKKTESLHSKIVGLLGIAPGINFTARLENSIIKTHQVSKSLVSFIFFFFFFLDNLILKIFTQLKTATEKLFLIVRSQHAHI
jgi:hypothetical protein